MKKIIAILLVFCMAAALCACDAVDKLKSVELPEFPNADEIQAEETPEVREEEQLPETAQPCRIIVTVTKSVKEFFDPDTGTKLILRFAYDTPKVYIEGGDEAAAAVNEYLGMLDETYYTGNDLGAGSAVGINLMYQYAMDNYSYIAGNGGDARLDFIAERTATAARTDEAVICVLFSNYSDYAGQGGGTEFEAYVFDSISGERVTADMLAEDAQALSQIICGCIADIIKADAEAAAAMPEGYEELLPELMADGFWFFNDEGLVLFDGACVLSNDMLSFTVPYEKLSGVMAEKWFPSEKNADGSVDIMHLEDYSEGSREIIDLISIDPDGSKLCLVADGTVYDVTLYSVGYDDATQSFLTTGELWYCSVMSDCIAQLSTRVSEGIPTLMVSYTAAGGETVKKLISESGEDGSIVLTGTDIQTLG